MQKKKIIFHQDTAPAHKSVLAMGKLRDLYYELLEHPPYSPDLAPSDLNEIADELARGGSAQRFVGPEPVLGVSRQNIRRKMKCWIENIQHCGVAPAVHRDRFEN